MNSKIDILLKRSNNNKIMLAEIKEMVKRPETTAGDVIRPVDDVEELEAMADDPNVVSFLFMR